MKKSIILFAALAVLTLLPSAPVRADIVLLDFSGGSSGEITGLNHEVGWAFTVNQTFDIGALSWYDIALNTDAPHLVSVWHDNGLLVTEVLVGSGASGSSLVLSAGNSGTANYWQTPITPVSLIPGSYVIGGSVNPDIGERVMYAATAVTTNPVITYTGNRSRDTAPGRPDIAFGDGGFFGPNLSAAVPEPSTYLLLTIALGAVSFCRRLKKNS